MIDKRNKIIFELGSWLSAALEDDNACKEFKDVINAWFELSDVNAIILNYEENNIEYIKIT